MSKQAALRRLLTVVDNLWEHRTHSGVSAADLATNDAMRRIHWAIYREQQGQLETILRDRPDWSGDITDEPPKDETP